MAVVPTSRRPRLAVAGVALAAFAVAITLGARPYVRGAAFVVQAAGLDGRMRTVSQWEFEPVTAGGKQPLPWRGGSVSSRIYQPLQPHGRGILLVPGVHAAGIDEPRLVGFARDLAGMGHPVLTVELPDLAHYEITARTTDLIEDAVAWMLQRGELTGPDRRIGMMGISFGGGLTLVAAGRPSIRDRVAFAMSFGGHGDLPRTLRYLCTGVQPDGTERPPHDYGLAIVLLGVADKVVPPDQAQPLRDAILAFLEASRLDMLDKAKAATEFAHAKALEESLAQPSRTYMQYVNARDVRRLGPVLLPYLAERGGDPALSPALSPPPRCPVYLLHGTDDNVVPAIESVLLAQSYRAHGVTVHQLATPLITHAEVDRSSTVASIWRLIDFWSKLLNE